MKYPVNPVIVGTKMNTRKRALSDMWPKGWEFAAVESAEASGCCCVTSLVWRAKAADEEASLLEAGMLEVVCR